MTVPAPDREPSALEYEARRARGRRISRFLYGLGAAWFLIFLATSLAVLSGYNRDVPRWRVPLVGAIALVCALYAFVVRRQRPTLAAGIFTGVAVGLLHAGWCFISY